MIKAILAALFLLLGADWASAQTRTPTKPAATMPASSLRKVDLMPAFWRYQERSRSLPDEQARVKLLRQLLITPNPDFYGKVVPAPTDSALAKFLRDVEPLLPRMRRLHTAFDGEFAKAMQSFHRAFPGAKKLTNKVYIAPSLFYSNGQSKSLNGEMMVFFGLDVQASVSAEPSYLLPLVHHEMFHLYHGTVNRAVYQKTEAALGAEPAPLFYSLFTEGMAAYVTKSINPQATMAQVLMNADLERQTQAVLPQVAGELRRKLESTDPADMSTYFFMNSTRTDIPKRSAYFVGYRVVEDLARRYTLEQLARLDGAAILREVSASLDQLSKG